jgi:WD40 repeat protein
MYCMARLVAWLMPCLQIWAPQLKCPFTRGPLHGCAGKVFMWDLVTKELLAQVPAHTGVITSLAVIGKDGITMLLSAGADKSIKVWEPQGG